LRLRSISRFDNGFVAVDPVWLMELFDTEFSVNTVGL
jgi:hypothetical protein